MLRFFALFIFVLFFGLSAFSAEACFSLFGGLKTSYENAQELRFLILADKSVATNSLVQESIFNIKGGFFSLQQSGHIDKSFLRKKSSEILDRAAQTSMTYEEYLNLSYDAVAFFELVYQKASNTLYRNLPDGFEANRHLVSKIDSSRLKEKVKSGILNMPLAKDLSFEEMNNLWMVGIRPYGISAREEFADLKYRSPLHFFNHDSAHALISGQNALPSELTKSAYYKIKLEIQNRPALERDAIERIIFYAIHEKGQELKSKKQMALTLAGGFDLKLQNTNKLTKKQIREIAEFMVPYKTGFTTPIDFIRAQNREISADVWENAIRYLYE